MLPTSVFTCEVYDILLTHMLPSSMHTHVGFTVDCWSHLFLRMWTLGDFIVFVFFACQVRIIIYIYMSCMSQSVMANALSQLFSEFDNSEEDGWKPGHSQKNRDGSKCASFSCCYICVKQLLSHICLKGQRENYWMLSLLHHSIWFQHVCKNIVLVLFSFTSVMRFKTNC